jgi:hypothetical protein
VLGNKFGTGYQVGLAFTQGTRYQPGVFQRHGMKPYCHVKTFADKIDKTIRSGQRNLHLGITAVPLSIEKRGLNPH